MDLEILSKSSIPVDDFAKEDTKEEKAVGKLNEVLEEKQNTILEMEKEIKKLKETIDRLVREKTELEREKTKISKSHTQLNKRNKSLEKSKDKLAGICSRQNSQLRNMGLKLKKKNKGDNES